MKLIFILLLLSVVPTYATVTLDAFSNYFNLVEQVSAKSFRIYAGSTYQTCSGDGTSPCNTCSQDIALQGASARANGLACNEQQIYPSLNFTITLRSDVAANYAAGCSNPILAMSGTTVINSLNQTLYTENVANQPITATYSWQEICNRLGNDPNCEKSFNQSFRIGFNSQCGGTAIAEGAFEFRISFRYVGNSPAMTYGCPRGSEGSYGAFEGVCDYLMYPGDQKAYVVSVDRNSDKNFQAGDQSSKLSSPIYGSSADLSGVSITHLRLYYGSTSFAGITLKSPYVDLPVTAEGGMQSRRVDGLENGVRYTFLAANKDQAGNLEYFSDPQSASNYLIMSDADTPLGETLTVIPEPVVGLLQDERCFIATAAFGTPQEVEVKKLRNFRDHYLLKSSWGQKFVSWYYEISPKFAKYISQNSWLKRVVRTMLWPLIWLVPEGQASQEEYKPWPESADFTRAIEDAKSGKDYIEHPLSEHGLIKMNADGSHEYALAISERQSTYTFGFQTLSYFDINNNFSKIYGEDQRLNMVLFGIDWVPFKERFANLSLRLNLGMGSFSGTGFLASSQLPSQEAFTLYAVPIGMQLVYRFDYFSRQWFAPYVLSGSGYMGIIEARDDAKSFKTAGSLFVESGAGLQFSLMRMSPKSMFALKRDFNVTDFWIAAEVKYLKSIKTGFDFSGLTSNFSFLLDF